MSSMSSILCEAALYPLSFRFAVSIRYHVLAPCSKLRTVCTHFRPRRHPACFDQSPTCTSSEKSPWHDCWGFVRKKTVMGSGPGSGLLVWIQSSAATNRSYRGHGTKLSDSGTAIEFWKGPIEDKPSASFRPYEEHPLSSSSN